MNLSNKKLNIDYALVQMSYWVTSAVLFCFTTVFLQFRGYSNYEIGIVFAVGNIIGFIAQPFIAGLIDKFIPDTENPHELHSVEEIGGVPNPEHTHRLRRMGIVTALAIAVHNFPEGIATFISALDSAKVGIAVAAAVAVHNIPEGIAVSVPIYFSTGSRKKAFWYSFASGLAEPVGAVFAYLLLMPFLTPVLMECTFAVVAGIMVYISLDELLPAAHQYGHSHLAIYGLVAGMAVMALSLILLG